MTRMMIPALAAAMLLAPGLALAAQSGHGISEAQARKDITLDGYTNVQNLHKTAQGWTASAQESGKPVTVLDNHGDVMKQ